MQSYYSLLLPGIGVTWITKPYPNKLGLSRVREKVTNPPDVISRCMLVGGLLK